MAVDEVSKTLGELVASVRSLVSQTRDQWGGIEELKAELNETNTLNRALARDVASLGAQVEKMAPHVEDYRRMKQRGITVIAMIGFLGGGLGVIGTKSSEIFWWG